MEPIITKNFIIKYVSQDEPFRNKITCEEYEPYHNPDSVEFLINYILRKDARPLGGQNIWGTYGAFHKNKQEIIESFYKTKRIYHKENGLQVRHIIVSFQYMPDISPKKSKKMIRKMVEFFSTQYQIVYALHEDTNHYHIHIALNSVDIYGSKISITSKEQKAFKKHIIKIYSHYAALSE